MMRIISIGLIIILAALPVYGDDLIGKVISINPEEGLIEVEVQHGHFRDLNETRQQRKFTQIGVRLLSVPGKGKMPGCLVPGRRVMFSGTFPMDNHRLFLATEVRGWGWRRGCDPTGVRSRIGRACRKKNRGKFRGPVPQVKPLEAPAIKIAP